MNEFEKKTSINQIGIEKSEGGEAQQEQLRQSILRSMADDKRATDSSIESKTRTVQIIFGSLERQTANEQQIQKEIVIGNPEEILNKVKNNLAKIENLTTDDISRVLINSGLEMRDIELWLIANRDDLQSLSFDRKSLETRRRELSSELIREEQRNFFIKLLRGKEKKVLAIELREIARQITQIDKMLREKQFRSSHIESTTQDITSKRQELAVNAAEQLFQSIIERNHLLKEKLISPEIKQELNADLISQIVLPELDKLQKEGVVTDKEAKDYLDFLTRQLMEGNQSNWVNWDDSIEKKEAAKARREKIDEFKRDLRDLGRRLSSEGNYPADINYDKIFDFLIREETRVQLVQARDMIVRSSAPELQERIGKIIEGTIIPDYNYQGERKEILDLSMIPIKVFDDLNGLERWPIVKKFAKSSGIIKKETFEQVERVVIQRLFEERLSPGGRESSDGTYAACKMGDLGNPEALPLMLRHIEANGPGHTNDIVVYQMERLLKESDPEALQKTLETQPKNKRFLLKLLVDENSYMSRFGKINSRYDTCYLLQNGDLTIAKEQLTKILENEGTFDEEKVKDFYLGYYDDNQEIVELFLKARAEVEKIIIDSKLNIWTQSADKLLSALVNQKYGESVAFPKTITKEGLEILDEKMLAVMDHIFNSKTFKRSGFERETFLDGLLLLNSKRDGKAVLETLLTAYRGSIDDSKRMRRIFQLLIILEDFGEYRFIKPDPEKVKDIQQEIFNLQNKFTQVTDKAERKKIKNAIETLEAKLQNLTGLKGIEETMTQQVVESACKKLDLPIKYQQRITENLEFLLKSGLFEIVPSLAGKYDLKNESEVKKLLKVITEHIIEGDFNSWRYKHERSETQLLGLSDEQKEFWKTNLEPISIEIELAEGESVRRADELKSAQDIIRNVKEHILDYQPSFDFSKTRFDELNAQVREVTKKIKLSSSEEEKKILILEKINLQAEATLIGGVLEVEMTTPKSFTREKILTQARELREKILELNIPLAGLDIEQVEKIFTVGDIKNITAYESDDPMTLLRVGVEPQETCQSWRKGGLNECLLSYVADSNKKVLNVADGEGRIVARSIIKLTNQRSENDFESKTQRKTLLVEKPYSLIPNSEVYRAFFRVLLMKAQGLDASITFGKDFNESTLKLFEEEARSFSYTMNEGKLNVFIPHSLNKYEYSDTFGGKISLFDRYYSLDAVTFEKTKTQKI